MPNVYRNQQRIPGLRGKVQGGITIVVDSPTEISGLQNLIRSAAELPGDPIANAYNAIDNAGSRISDWPRWHDSRTPGVPPSEEVPIDGPVSQLDAALGLADMLWVGQKDDVNQIALAMVLPTPGKRRLVLEAQRPMLLLDAGSVRARIASAGAKIKQFGVALFPKAPSRRRGNLVEALRARSQGGHPLPRLEGLNSADLESKRGVIVFLHGLMSSDAGTFDELVVRIENDNSPRDVYLVGRPHDTLARIKVNAQELAELIEDRLGPSGLPLLFVCHSRGGLVARAAAVKLVKGNPHWAERLIGAVTFGTPHLGAELAERGDEFLGKLLLLKAIWKAGSVPLIDALCVISKHKKIEGISDLRPTINGGKFLYRLREDEAKQAGGAGKRVLPMFVVGGRAEPGSKTGWLSRRFFGGEPNDLVVALSSSAPSSMPPLDQTKTDHFGYFSVPEMQKRRIPALDFIVAAFKAPALKDQSRSLPSKSRVRVTPGGTALHTAPPQPQAKSRREA
jgi:Putative serine esterase (DUF676)